MLLLMLTWQRLIFRWLATLCRRLTLWTAKRTQLPATHRRRRSSAYHQCVADRLTTTHPDAAPMHCCIIAIRALHVCSQMHTAMATMLTVREVENKQVVPATPEACKARTTCGGEREAKAGRRAAWAESADPASAEEQGRSQGRAGPFSAGHAGARQRQHAARGCSGSTRRLAQPGTTHSVAA